MSLVALTCGFACGAPLDDEPLGSEKEALTGAQILGFEDATGWSLTSGTLAAGSVRVQGNAAFDVSGFAYTELTSAPLSTLSGVTSSIAYDLMIPPEQPNPDWYGLTQLYVSIPSQGVNNQF
ncbi:MAG TPA: hypothetical protein VF103_07800, partial [Polyangiaceae bacterium]